MYLQIGGFNIKILFIPREKKQLTDDLRIYIPALFTGFLLKKTKTCDFAIELHRPVYPPNVLQMHHRREKIYLQYFYTEKQKRIITPQHISNFQFFFILSGVVLKLLNENGGFILHASSVIIDRKATLFIGPSGAGKSTAAFLLKEKYPVIADDSIIIKRGKSGKYYCYQTPFQEKNKSIERKKKRYKIGRIFFLRKSPYFQITKIREKEWICRKLSKQLLVNKQYSKQLFKNLVTFVKEYNNFALLSFAKEKNEMMRLF